MNQKIIYLIIFILMSLFAYSQSFDKGKMDRYFDALEQHDKFMGGIALSQNGEVIYSRSIGFSDLEKEAKADSNSKYRIGSISKTFTAVLVLKGVEEGEIDLTQTIDKYFPGIIHADKITINHLLYHRSGIHNFTNDADYLSWNTNPKTEEEMIEIIRNAGSDFEPDSQAGYSNSNYVLLTYILEKSFQKSYTDLVSFYITQPVGLENTFMGGRINPENNECLSYLNFGEWRLQTETDISVPLGAGGIVSTPLDLVKFSDALFNGRLLKPESLEKMKTIKDNLGMGVFQIPFYENTGIGHTGGIDGFSSVFAHFTDGNVSYALTSNGTNIDNNDISIAVLSAVFGRDYDIPTFSTYEVSEEDLLQYTGIYSTDQLPLKITISIENNALVGQATGQPSFVLEPAEKDVFKFDLAKLVLEFNPEENTMVLKQGGGVFTFSKE